MFINIKEHRIRVDIIESYKPSYKSTTDINNCLKSYYCIEIKTFDIAKIRVIFFDNPTERDIILLNMDEILTAKRI